MRKIKEVLRLRFDLGLSVRKSAVAAGVPRTTASDYIKRFEAAPCTIEEALKMEEEHLDSLLFPEKRSCIQQTNRPMPELESIHREIHKKGVTFLLLWQEYKERHPDGYGYTQFKEHYHRFRKMLNPSMRQLHLAGEKMFVDYSGLTFPITDGLTGEISHAQIFVAVLGASGYTFVHATRSQKREDFITSHGLAFEFFGGVPEAIVPDNLKSAVTSHTRKGVVLNESYTDMARHYGCAVLPARPRKPKDKGKVEQGVQAIQRWILAKLRHHTFFDVDELNDAISGLLDQYNAKVIRRLEKSRTKLFEELDRPALSPLPANRYVYREFLLRTVPVDYHVEIQKCLYSVPYSLLKQKVEVWYSGTTVEIYAGGRQVALHPRLYRKGEASTLKEHMPLEHQYQQERWNPGRILNWAASIGPDTVRLVKAIMEDRNHVVLAYKPCQAILSFSQTYGKEELEKASARAMEINTRTVAGVESLLKLKRYDREASSPANNTLHNDHENLRGSGYYAAVAGGDS